MKYFKINNIYIVINSPNIYFGVITKLPKFGYIGFKVMKDFTIKLARRKGNEITGQD